MIPPDTVPPAPGDGSPTSAADVTPTLPPAELGRLGKFRLLRELGRGGMGVVYLAFDERLQRQAALKVMLPEVAADANARERFLREARAAACVRSDHVVSVFEADECDGTPYLAMQFLEGISLARHLEQRGVLAIPEVLRIGRETALGLDAAHRLGLVHRDVKPGNLWLEAPGGRVKVLDFGLAKPLDANAAKLTGSGAVMGTPAYLAPEQGMAKPVDGRADLFSLGCVLYHLCTGKLPFDRPSIMAILTAIATEEPTPVRQVNPDVPEALADLIRRLMAKQPADRPADAAAVAAELARLAEGASVAPPLRRRRSPAWAALALLPLLALAAWFLFRPGRPAVVPETGPLAGSVDVQIVRVADNGSEALAPLDHPLALPLRTGDEFKIVAEVSRPAYLYLFWIDETGVGVPVYPWTPQEWGTRPANERPVTSVPPHKKYFTVTGDTDGMQTVVMLARSEKLEASEADVQGWFAGLKPLPFRGPQARVWFEDFRVVTWDEKRAFAIAGDVGAEDGPRGLQAELRRRIGKHGEFARAVSFAWVGRKK